MYVDSRSIIHSLGIVLTPGLISISANNNGDNMPTKLRSCLPLVLLFGLYVAPAFSAMEVESGVTAPPEGDITKQRAREMIKEGKTADVAVAHITEPTDGSTIKALTRNKLKYEVTGADGIHARLYIDGKQSALLRKRIGTHRIAKLPAGVHELCVQAIDKSHKEVGAAKCVKVTAQ